jgi:hypothetical protein
MCKSALYGPFRRSILAPPDSDDSQPRNAQIFFDRVILTLAQPASDALPARRGVLPGRDTALAEPAAALIRT